MVESVEPSPNEMIGSAAAIALCSGNHSIMVFTGEMYMMPVPVPTRNP